MGYVGVKSRKNAIINAEELVKYYRCKNGGIPLDVKQIRQQMRLLVDKVMSGGPLRPGILTTPGGKDAPLDSYRGKILQTIIIGGAVYHLL
jgi:alpha-D-ribose 1-methylphosphonate 5-triphosphate synthase subunit PhnI